MDWRKEMINCEKTDTDDYLIIISVVISYSCFTINRFHVMIISAEFEIFY